MRAVVHRHDDRAAGDRRRDLVDRGLAGPDRQQRHVRPAGLVLLALHQVHDLGEPRAEHCLGLHRPGGEQRGQFAGAVPGDRRHRELQVLQDLR